MTEFTGSPYAEWLEDIVETIFREKPECIAIGAKLASGDTMTGYYQCGVEDKAVLAHHIQSDAMLDMVLNNIDLIRDALDEYEENEE